MRNRCLILALGAVLVSPRGPGRRIPPEQPTFRATTERVVIDAAVVDEAGRPITDVTAAEFDLKIDGKPRGLLSVEFLPHLAEPAAPAPGTGFASFSSNERAQAGRLVLIAIDQNTINIGRGRTAFSRQRHCSIGSLLRIGSAWRFRGVRGWSSPPTARRWTTRCRE